jgi:hypothetical protein
MLMERYLTGNDGTGIVRKREKISQKTLGPLRRVAEKLRSFSFLDPTVEPMAEVVEHCLSLLPPEGPIEGVYLVHIWTLARTLANEKAAEEAAVIAMQMSSPSQAFEELLTKSADSVSAAAIPAASPAQHSAAASVVPESQPQLPAGPAGEFVPDLAATFF